MHWAKQIGLIVVVWALLTWINSTPTTKGKFI